MTILASSVGEQAPTRFGIKQLYRDAGSMATSSVANAILGAVFWACAARLYPPEALGVMTAVLAVIVSAGLVVAAGVGDAYTALLPSVGAARQRVYRRGQRVFWVMGATVGVGCAVSTVHLLPGVRGSIATGLLVALGVLAWSAYLQQNYTMIALGRARWLPAANIAASLGKILMLVLLSMAVIQHGVELAFGISALAIMLVMRPVIVGVIRSGRGLPQVATLSESQATNEFNRLVVRTISSATLSLGVINLAPFLVTIFAGPRQGALFALALSIVQALDFVIAALAMSLIVHASSSPEDSTRMARIVLIKAGTLAAVGAILIAAFAPWGLRLLNAEYGRMGAAGVISVLAAGYVIRTGFVVWSALQSSRRKMNAPLLLNFVAAALLLGSIPGLCHFFGALGGAVALLFVNCVLSAGAGIHLMLARRGGTNRPAAWFGTVGRKEAT